MLAFKGLCVVSFESPFMVPFKKKLWCDVKVFVMPFKSLLVVSVGSVFMVPFKGLFFMVSFQVCLWCIWKSVLGTI